MLSTTRRLTAQWTAQYGEDAAADWAAHCTKEEFIRVCGVADFLIYCGPPTPSGGGMMAAKAVAIAAVFIHEGAPRHLARKNRKKLDPARYAGPDPTMDSFADLEAQRRAGQYCGVTEQFEAFWSPSVDVS
ncbi:hypothetical protein ABZU76_01960 [Amycolatopsis sp. NPDC005232]|uniref:hypothetical protein n=1 Tax=Amycolatopsis sp. NPDC005232 TaxID=3157027 RepID=UPI0033ACB842